MSGKPALKTDIYLQNYTYRNMPAKCWRKHLVPFSKSDSHWVERNTYILDQNWWLHDISNSKSLVNLKKKNICFYKRNKRVFKKLLLLQLQPDVLQKSAFLTTQSEKNNRTRPVPRHSSSWCVWGLQLLWPCSSSLEYLFWFFWEDF